MSDIRPNPKPLTPLTLSDLEPDKPWNVMPAKTCRWQFNSMREETATEAIITYAKKPRGKMWKQGGEWFGELRVRIRVREGDVRECYGFALEGYPSSKICGTQIWYKFCKSAEEQGLVFR